MSSSMKLSSFLQETLQKTKRLLFLVKRLCNGKGLGGEIPTEPPRLTTI